MNRIKKYIEENLNISIKYYINITVDDNNKVIEYETPSNIIEINNATMEDFLATHKEIMGMYSKEQTFIGKGHEAFILGPDEIINNCIFSDNYSYSYITTKNPNFLCENIKKFADLLILDITDIIEFNYNNLGILLKELEELDEMFENHKVTRVYKKYNSYFIFY